MRNTIEKALKANRTAGNSERIIVDGVTFTRFPLNQAVLCIYAGYDNRYAKVADAMEAAMKAKAHLLASGMSWEEIEQKYSASDPLHSNIHGEIWRSYNATLKIFNTVFLHEPKDNRGIWAIPDDYIAVYPRDASHFLVAEYFPSQEDVKYLKRTFFIRSDIAGHPSPDDTYFTNIDKWNPETMEGILKV